MATYCLRADGTAASKAAATGPISNPARCMAVAVHNASTFSAGDKVIIGGQGGLILDMLVPPSSGVTYQTDDIRAVSPGKAVRPNFSASGQIYVADVTDPVFDVFLYSVGDTASAVLSRNNTSPTTPAAGEWGQSGGKLYVRLPDGSNPNGACYAVTSPQVVNIVGKSDVVVDGLVIPFSAYYDWHGHLGGIVFNSGCNGCQAKNIKAAYSQHGLTIYSQSVDCVADRLAAVDCYSAGVAIAQGFANQHNTGSILRNSKFTRCGLEGGGAFAVVAHGATATGVVKNVLIELCEIVQGEGADWGHGLSLWLADGVRVKKCRVSGFGQNGKAGISCADTVKNLQIENNIIGGCYNGINYTGAANIVGNYIKDAGYCCIRANKARGNIVGNTLDANNKSSGYPVAVWGGDLSNFSDNILLRGRYSLRDMTSNSRIENYQNNDVFDCRDQQNIKTIVNNSGNIAVDPGVIDKEGRVTAASPVIKAGVVVSGVTDSWVDYHGYAAGSTPNIGSDQNKFAPAPPPPPEPDPQPGTEHFSGGNLSEWVQYVGNNAMMEFSKNAPAKLLRVQIWNAKAFGIDFNAVDK